MIYLSSPKNYTLIQRKLEQNKIHKIALGVYSDDFATPDDEQVKQSLLEIMDYLNVRGSVAYKSALEHPNYEKGVVHITGKRTREILLPGFEIRVYAASEREALPHFMSPAIISGERSDNLSVPSIERAILENLLPAKPAAKKSDPQLALSKLGSLLEEGIATSGEGFKEKQLSRFESIGQALKMGESLPAIRIAINEFSMPAKLDTGRIYDHARMKLFDDFAEKIHGQVESGELLKDSREGFSQKELSRIAFYESYFSNYIEGTEFEVEEADAIIFNPDHQYQRHREGNDIRHTYAAIMDDIKNTRSEKSESDYFELLKWWHQSMFSHRVGEIRVGEFKEKANKAGNTRFVLPELVEGTLSLSIKRSRDIPPGIGRALFLKACLTEIHPFDDGNGRISRLLLNHELQKAGEKRLIVPTVYRDDYMTAMKAFSNGSTAPFIRMSKRLMMINRSIDWHRKDVREFLSEMNAFANPDQAMWGVVQQKAAQSPDDSNDAIDIPQFGI